MNWKAYHNRGETLRSVIAVADTRRDGELPMDIDGVTQTFRDELDLLGALSLKWHTRLSGKIERHLAAEPIDLERAVASAWGETAEELAGVRLILDNYRAHPIDYAMAGAMSKAMAKEHQLLAVAAGRAGIHFSENDPSSAAVGAGIEERARKMHQGAVFTKAVADSTPTPTLLDRIRAVMAA